MIVVRLDRILADRKMKLSELASEIDITVANLSNLKTGKAKAIRFSTLDAICKALECQPADIIEYTDNESWATNNEQKSYSLCKGWSFYYGGL